MERSEYAVEVVGYGYVMVCELDDRLSSGAAVGVPPRSFVSAPPLLSVVEDDATVFKSAIDTYEIAGEVRMQYERLNCAAQDQVRVVERRLSVGDWAPSDR